MTHYNSAYDLLQANKQKVASMMSKYNGDHDTHEGQPAVTFNEYALAACVFDILTQMQFSEDPDRLVAEQQIVVGKASVIPEWEPPFLTGNPKPGNQRAEIEKLEELFERYIGVPIEIPLGILHFIFHEYGEEFNVDLGTATETDPETWGLMEEGIDTYMEGINE